MSTTTTTRAEKSIQALYAQAAKNNAALRSATRSDADVFHSLNAHSRGRADGVEIFAVCLFHKPLTVGIGAKRFPANVAFVYIPPFAPADVAVSAKAVGRVTSVEIGEGAGIRQPVVALVPYIHTYAWDEGKFTPSRYLADATPFTVRGGRVYKIEWGGASAQIPRGSVVKLVSLRLMRKASKIPSYARDIATDDKRRSDDPTVMDETSWQKRDDKDIPMFKKDKEGNLKDTMEYMYGWAQLSVSNVEIVARPSVESYTRLFTSVLGPAARLLRFEMDPKPVFRMGLETQTACIIPLHPEPATPEAAEARIRECVEANVPTDIVSLISVCIEPQHLEPLTDVQLAMANEPQPPPDTPLPPGSKGPKISAGIPLIFNLLRYRSPTNWATEQLMIQLWHGKLDKKSGRGGLGDFGVSSYQGADILLPWLRNAPQCATLLLEPATVEVPLTGEGVGGSVAERVLTAEVIDVFFQLRQFLEKNAVLIRPSDFAAAKRAVDGTVLFAWPLFNWLQESALNSGATRVPKGDIVNLSELIRLEDVTKKTTVAQLIEKHAGFFKDDTYALRYLPTVDEAIDYTAGVTTDPAQGLAFIKTTKKAGLLFAVKHATAPPEAAIDPVLRTRFQWQQLELTADDPRIRLAESAGFAYRSPGTGVTPVPPLPASRLTEEPAPLAIAAPAAIATAPGKRPIDALTDALSDEEDDETGDEA